MKRILLLLVAIVTIVACKKDDEESSKSSNHTSAVISLEDSSGDPVSNVVVYAYDENTWQVIGDDPFFADFESASDASGIAEFSNLESPTRFNTVTNNTHTFRFSAHYSINGSDRVEVVAITFDKGERKTGKIILD